jgi:hypothetical protein
MKTAVLQYYYDKSVLGLKCQYKISMQVITYLDFDHTFNDCQGMLLI